MTSENNTGKPNLKSKSEKKSDTNQPPPKTEQYTFYNSDTNVEKHFFPVLVVSVLLDEDFLKPRIQKKCQKVVTRNLVNPSIRVQSKMSENEISGDISYQMTIQQNEKQAENLPSFESTFRTPKPNKERVQKRPRNSKNSQFPLTSIEKLCDKSTQTDMWQKGANQRIGSLPTYEEAINTKTSGSDFNDEDRDIINMVANWETELENAHASN